jgi:hypothetical protein
MDHVMPHSAVFLSVIWDLVCFVVAIHLLLPLACDLFVNNLGVTTGKQQ